MIDSEKITFKVMGENKINEILNYSMPLYIELFKGEEGKQILKSGYSVVYGELLKKYSTKTDLLNKQIEQHFKSEDITPQIYLKVSEYSVYLNVRLRFNNLKQDGFLYYEGYKYILNLSDGNLKSIFEFNQEEEINENEQLKIYQRCLNLIEELRTERAKLKPYSLSETIKL